MTLTLYGFQDRPHDFSVTTVGADLEDCAFVLDFSRPLERLRWLGVRNRWLGVTLGLLVPVVHQGEEQGGYVFSLGRSEPYFVDLPTLWKEHGGQSRTIRGAHVGAMQVAADFAKHFPGDCQ